MNSDKDKSIDKDNVVVVKNDTTVVQGQTEKERKAYFDKMLKNEIAQYTAKEAATENRRMKKNKLL